MGLDKGITTTGVVAEVEAAIRGQKRSGADDVISHRCQQKRCSMGGCTRHTYIDKDGVQRPAHLLIKCSEFLCLSRALLERMQTEQPVAGAIAYNAPPPPPNPPANVMQQGHQAAMIQQVEPQQPAAKEEAFLPP
jgi:hypothetical protein